MLCLKIRRFQTLFAAFIKVLNIKLRAFYLIRSVNGMKLTQINEMKRLFFWTVGAKIKPPLIKNNKRLRVSNRTEKPKQKTHQRFSLNGKTLLSRNLYHLYVFATEMRRNAQRVCKVYHQPETINIKKEVVTIPKKKQQQQKCRATNERMYGTKMLRFFITVHDL